MASETGIFHRSSQWWCPAPEVCRQKQGIFICHSQGCVERFFNGLAQRLCLSPPSCLCLRFTAPSWGWSPHRTARTLRVDQNSFHLVSARKTYKQKFSIGHLSDGVQLQNCAETKNFYFSFPRLRWKRIYMGQLRGCVCHPLHVRAHAYQLHLEAGHLTGQL